MDKRQFERKAEHFLIGDIKLRGEVCLHITDPLTGRTYYHSEDHNLVLDAMYNFLRCICTVSLGGGTSNDRAIINSGGALYSEEFIRNSILASPVDHVYLTDSARAPSALDIDFDGKIIAEASNKLTADDGSRFGTFNTAASYLCAGKMYRRWDWASTNGNGYLSKIFLGPDRRQCGYDYSFSRVFPFSSVVLPSNARGCNNSLFYNFACDTSGTFSFTQLKFSYNTGAVEEVSHSFNCMSIGMCRPHWYQESYVNEETGKTEYRWVLKLDDLKFRIENSGLGYISIAPISADEILILPCIAMQCKSTTSSAWSTCNDCIAIIKYNLRTHEAVPCNVAAANEEHSFFNFVYNGSSQGYGFLVTDDFPACSALYAPGGSGNYPYGTWIDITWQNTAGSYKQPASFKRFDYHVLDSNYNTTVCDMQNGLFRVSTLNSSVNYSIIPSSSRPGYWQIQKVSDIDHSLAIRLPSLSYAYNSQGTRHIIDNRLIDGYLYEVHKNTSNGQLTIQRTKYPDQTASWITTSKLLSPAVTKQDMPMYVGYTLTFE